MLKFIALLISHAVAFVVGLLVYHNNAKRANAAADAALAELAEAKIALAAAKKVI